MRPHNPLVVRTTGGATYSIATRMGDMRTWLDCNRIELTRFEVVTVSLGNVAFDAQFAIWSTPLSFAPRSVNRHV
jgi:hypothetical protein